MPEEKNLETIPVGPLGIIALDSFKDQAAKVDEFIAGWRSNRTGTYTHTIAFSGYQKDSYLIDAKLPVLVQVKQRESSMKLSVVKIYTFL